MKPPKVRIIDWSRYNALFLAEHLLGYKKFYKILGGHQAKLYNKIDSYLGEVPEIKVNAVEEADKGMSSAEFLETCYKSRLPRVFRGAAAQWPAVQKWDLDFFEENYGHEKIILNDNVGLADQEFEEMDFGHYIRQLRSGSLKYLRFSEIVNNHKELKEDFDMGWLRNFLHSIPYSWSEDAKMFMGKKGTLTPLHVGFSDFLFVQVKGRKKWILYPPNNRLFLDARTERTMYFYSNADPYEVDKLGFPLFKHAEKYEVYLEPGDVLWVPSFFWHHVENLSDSIGIRVGRTSIHSASKSSKMLTTLFFMATKPNLFLHMLTLRSKKKELLFTKSQKNKGGK